MSADEPEAPPPRGLMAEPWPAAMLTSPAEIAERQARSRPAAPPASVDEVA